MVKGWFGGAARKSIIRLLIVQFDMYYRNPLYEVAYLCTETLVILLRRIAWRGKLFWFRRDLFDNALASGFEHIGYIFKVASVSIVGVWNNVVYRIRIKGTR